jgi:antitoxin VapB
MPQTRSAKLFKNGSSQAVRLPAEFRFEGTEIYATRDETTGDVTLSKSPGAQAWKDFFAFARTVDVPEEFMADRPMNQVPSRLGFFDDLIEDVKPKRRKAK